MQAVFFLSLFSLVFLMFSSLSAGLSKNIMQENIEKIKETEYRFEAIETALSVLVYKQKVNDKNVIDLSYADHTNLNGNFLSQHIGYTKKQISHDPWEKPVKLFKHTKKEAIWGAAGQTAKAPITTIMLVSAGPNGKYDILDYLGQPQGQTVLSETDLTQTDITDKDVIGDDIVVRFNNYDAMLEIWEKVEAIDNTIKNVAFDYYRGKLDAFTPLIQLAERDTDTGGHLSENIFDGIENTTFDPTLSYVGFDELANNKDAYSVNWNKKGEPINDILKEYRKKAIEYVAGSMKFSEDTTESNKIEQDFIKKYEDEATGANRKFQYPSYDAVIKDANGGTLSSVQQGLKNLGVRNIESVDPFAGYAFEAVHGYDEDKPNIIDIVRKSTEVANNKWEIDKKITVDGLGGI